MKNMMLIISIIIGYCFANTGILADKNYSAFGIWANVSRTIDCDECEETKEVSLDYMTKVGLEIGLNAGQVGDIDIAGAHLSYHFKSNSLYQKGTNFYIGYAMEELSLEDQDEPYAEKTTLSLGVYSNKKSYFEISQESLSVDFMDYELDFETEFVKFGGIIRFGQKAGFNIGYKIDVDVLDAMFEEEDFELLKNGTLELSIGGNF